MKWLILLGLIILVGGMIALRYRQQIKMALYVWRMFRKMRKGGQPNEKQINKPENTKDAALIRCVKCGTWTPQNQSVKLRSGLNYCSAKCLETAVSRH